jgi:hypothetical protein
MLTWAEKRACVRWMKSRQTCALRPASAFTARQKRAKSLFEDLGYQYIRSSYRMRDRPGCAAA